MKLTFKVKAILIAGFITGAVIGTAGIQSYLDYRDTEEQAYKAAMDVTLVVEAQLRDTLKSAENMVDNFSDKILEKGISVTKDKDFVKELKIDCVSVKGCEVVGIAMPNGDAILNVDNGTINVSDREYFKKAIETKKLYISPAVVARLPHKPIVFHIAKPVFDKKGTLVAVVAVAMHTNHITGFYSLLGFGFSPTISVFKLNGDIVSRNPDMDKHVGKSNAKSRLFQAIKKAPADRFLSISHLDGKVRLGGYRLIEDLDMVIFAGVEKEIAFKNWNIRAIRVVSIIGGLLSVTLLAFYFAYRLMVQKEVLKLKNEKLDELSNVDELTSIGNRRLFENTIKQEWSRYKRNNVDFSILLIDVDFFKPYNDNYGHQEGDKTLFKVAQAIQECVKRPTDLVARYGGEEFVAIVNNDEKGALIVAEKIRQKIESLDIKHDFSLISKGITASIGLTSTSYSNAKDIEELIKEADIALYKAKKAGRNRVEAFKPSDKE